MAEPPFEITPDILLQAYASGVFPMADSADDDEIFWVDPERRGIIPLDGFHVSRSLRRRMRKGGYQVSVNTAFDEVVALCADRPTTWINAEIKTLYNALFQRGFAHSQEVWRDGSLIGGVYGVTLGAAFFGESMFSRATDGSKIALAHLVERLKAGGYELFDTQFITDHLASLGAVEIPRKRYRTMLASALTKSANFFALDG